LATRNKQLWRGDRNQPPAGASVGVMSKAEPGFIKRRNRINGQWQARLIEMLESPAYRALSLSAHRLMSRIEVELGHHGGNDNGRLPVTFEDFIEYGIHRDAIAPAMRELEALGFIRVTERGRGGNAEHRQSNKFFLTYAHGRDSRANPPTHDWRKIKTMEEAMEIAEVARDNKNPRVVQFAQRRAKKIKPRSRKPGSAPITETRGENPKSPITETRTTASPRKPGLLSISRVGSPRYALSTSSAQSYAGYSSLPLELRLMALGLSSAKNFGLEKFGGEA
jgi:hypothetical protein